MKTVMLASALVSLAAAQAPDCVPPPAVAARLTAILRYENGLGQNEPHSERFSLLKIGGLTYLLQSTVPENYDPSVRPVWVFDDNVSSVAGPETSCPPDQSWPECAVHWRGHQGLSAPALRSGGASSHPSTAADSRVCGFTLKVPRWDPSPDSPEKRRIAAELVVEFQEFGYTNAERIVVRDFNLEDPDITAWITSPRGEERLQGCTFVRGRSPHCAWHLFGQSPLESLRGQIMSKPYQIYPRSP